MPYTGEYVPNYGAMGMDPGEGMPTGTGAALGYGNAPPSPSGGIVQTAAQTGSQDSAAAPIGYSRYVPRQGYADRLRANIVGGGSDSLADGGYSSVTTQRL